MELNDWRGDPQLKEYVEDIRSRHLTTYSNDATRLKEDARDEEMVRQGGYSNRQIHELIQNAVDALERNGTNHRIEIRQTRSHLYVGNSGNPLDRAGVESLCYSNLSEKRSTQVGRFGIGFKSLSAWGCRIEILSRTVSLAFDPEESCRLLKNQLGPSHDAKYPSMRVPFPVDAIECIREDPVLQEMASWAATIVRIFVGTNKAVSKQLDELSARCFLFAASGLVVKIGDDEGHERTTSVDWIPSGDIWRLCENGEESRWRLFRRLLDTPNDPDIQEDASDLLDHLEMGLTWAVPLEERVQAGEFFCLFPIEPSKVPGLLNGPFKVNQDRTGLVPGPYNDFLVSEAAHLIADVLPMLANSGDPGRILDYLPREISRGEPERPVMRRLVDEVWKAVGDLSIVPDAEGELRPAADLLLPPKPVRSMPEPERRELAQSWQDLASQEAKKRFAHVNVLTRERLARLETLRKGWPEEGPDALTRWVEEAASNERAMEVLRFLRKLLEKLRPNDYSPVRQAKVIPDQDGVLRSSDEVRLFPDENLPEVRAVRDDLASSEEARDILVNVLQVKEPTEDDWASEIQRRLEALLRDGVSTESETIPLNLLRDVLLPEYENPWEQWWSLLRACPRQVQARGWVSRTGARFRWPFAKTASGRWRNLGSLLRLGRIVTAQDIGSRGEGSLDPGLFVMDPEFEKEFADVLDALNVEDVPWRGQRWDRVPYESEIDSTVGCLHPNFWWLSKVRSSWDHRRIEPGKRNQRWIEWVTLVEPIDALFCSSPPVHERMTKHLLTRWNQSHNGVEIRKGWQGPSVRHPIVAALVDRGVLGGLAFRSVVRLIQKEHGDLLDLLPTDGLADYQPALEKIAGELEPLKEDEKWAKDIIRLCRIGFDSDQTLDETRAEKLIALAAETGQVPDAVKLGDRMVPITELYVCSHEQGARRFREAGKPALHIEGEALDRVVLQGAKRIEHSWDQETEAPIEPPDYGLSLQEGAPALYEVRGLRWAVEGEEGIPDEHFFHRDSNTLYVDSTWFWHLPEPTAGLADVLTDWLVAEPESSLPEPATTTSDLTTLLLQIVPDREDLVKSLPEAVQDLARGLDDPNLAYLVLSVHGPETLRQLRSALERRGYVVPNCWGTARAVEFARSLGFPEEYAGSPTRGREPYLEVPGPVPLGPLKAHQQEVIGTLNAFLKREGEPGSWRRLMVSLPTGAGKTRVVVQALTETVLQSDEDVGVLWVADSDELCEQAVTCFRQVWANFGRPNVSLRVQRLWGTWGWRNRNVTHSSPRLVVTTRQTLHERIVKDFPDLAWLQGVQVLVLDEAHHAVAPSYTEILRALDRTEGSRKLVIGMTATPYRGFNEEESERLRKRFEGHLVPPAEEQPLLYRRLLEERILAATEFEPLEGASEFWFDDDDIHYIERFHDIPDSALRRLADDLPRLERVVARARSLGQEGQVLVFAPSVENAQVTAARLILEGVSAAAIVGTTPAEERRHFIQEFQRGHVRVLTTAQVLTTGFDAPKVDAIIVARPTFSTVLYQQMIGRGLRGPEMGGKERCRIVTVEDNLDRFGERLAWHYFVDLWS